jgi:hypothetical protein
MEKKIEKALDNFIDDPSIEDVAFDNKVKEQKKKFLRNGNGLVERLDTVFIDESGRQLLREIY